MKNQDKPPPLAPAQAKPTDAAFDVWLNRGLHQLFDDIANEPVPEDLLKLIQQDSEK